MQTYSGRCRGGPKDGEDLISVSREVGYAKVKWATAPTADTPLTTPDKIERGYYVHILGQWVWHQWVGHADR
jgi:hypothetical protein